MEEGVIKGGVDVANTEDSGILSCLGPVVNFLLLFLLVVLLLCVFFLLLV